MSDLENSLGLLRELQAIAQNGLAFTKDPFDRDRYLRLRQIVEERLSASDGVPTSFDAEALLGAEKGYITPKAEVRAAAFRDGRILMVREISDGLWTLPGGWADVNQSPSEAIVKEIREESGFEARATKLAAVWDRRRHGHPPAFHHAYKLFFLCDLVGGAAQGSIETSEVGFFPEDDLPPLSIHRVTAEQIRAMFRHERQRDLPTEFD
jgi:ADP-ribose pyrophosphatase YjhB (NUDIX family)